MADVVKKMDVHKGPWYRARMVIGFGDPALTRPRVLAGEYFQLDDDKMAANLLKDGAITKATEADAKKKKTVDADAERVATEIQDGKEFDQRGNTDAGKPAVQKTAGQPSPAAPTKRP